MTIRMIVDDNQQVSEGSGPTSLYLLAAPLVFLALMALAWMSPNSAHAQSNYEEIGANNTPGTLT